MKTRLLALTLITLASSVLVKAQFLYTANNGAVSITGYTGTNRDVVIPSTIYTLPVTSIGTGAFGNLSTLNTISIPDTVTNMGDHVFEGCFRLTGMTIPDSVLTIGNQVFAYCSSLTNITIGKGLRSMDYAAFLGCNSLNTITVDAL